MNPIGIMQGRLSPPVGGRIQSFPLDTWREEFCHAKEAGLDCIEFIYEAETKDLNPLCHDDTISEIIRLMEDTGIAVWSVCADYFMTERLISPDGSVVNGVLGHLSWLIGRISLIGVRHIVLPFVDSSSLKSEREIDALVNALQAILPLAERTEVELHLETDLKPKVLYSILERIPHSQLKANYDIGNSASLGYDPEEELKLIGLRLGSVHVKDRILGGGSVPLGTGAADFRSCFRLIRNFGYNGIFILQAAREKGISEIELAISNRKFVEDQYAATVNEAGKQ